MMKSVAATLVFALYALVLPLIVGAEPVAQYDAPHYDPGTGYTCVNCHTSSLSLGSIDFSASAGVTGAGSLGYNNVCLSCHRLGDPRAGDPTSGGLPFTPQEAANPFNNHTTSGLLYQTSHSWSGTDTEPRAGAQPPIAFNMDSDNLRARTGNGLACVRCHDPHRNDNSCAACHDPNYNGNVLGPDGKTLAVNFLRVPNDRDQMCLDCHRSWNVTDHQRGSHPVLVNYSASKTAKPGQFNYPAMNANSANPSSDLNARLALTGKQVVCTTCHGVHYSDSRSSTVDGTAANFLNLSTSSEGFVLRTDRRGAKVAAGQADSVNICSNCHAAKSNHNASGQDIQCDDCHGAHVAYDAADPTGSKGTNVYLIRRDILSGGLGKVFYRYTSSAKKEYVNTDGAGKGVCQGCHRLPSTFIHTNAQANGCAGCHSHTNGNGSFSASCTACHPNLGGSHAAHVGNLMSLVAGYAVGTYYNDNNSNSTGYRFGCISCHPKSNLNHGNNTIVLNTKNGSAGITRSNITCSASACHSDGKGNFATSPNWYHPEQYVGDKCAMCHAAQPTTGSHSAHLALSGIHTGIVSSNGTIVYGSEGSFKCYNCHADTVVVGTTNSIKYQNHVNGVANVAFGGVVQSRAQVMPASFNAYSTIWTRTGGYKVDANSIDITKNMAAGTYAGGSCSTIACHNNGTAQWAAGSTVSCIDCHSQL
jgi:predicted CxxxxCH...CXXCH cytochrome family protein